jgi:hypothetical protein
MHCQCLDPTAHAVRLTRPRLSRMPPRLPTALLLLLSRLEPLAPVAGLDHLIALGNLIAKGAVCRLEECRTHETCASARFFALGSPLPADPAPLAFSPFP